MTEKNISKENTIKTKFKTRFVTLMIGVMAMTGLATAGSSDDEPSVASYTATNCKTVRLENWLGQGYEPPPVKTNDEREFSCWKEPEISGHDKNNLA